MDYWIRSKKAKALADANARERLKNHKYSKDVLQAFDLVQTPQSETANISIALVLMDIAWQISGNIPSENELARVFFPIQNFFLGTVYQDNLLDSLRTESPRELVKTLGVPTCLIMGNILYCEALLSLLEVNGSRNNNKVLQLLNSLEKLVRTVGETEIYRRNHIGKILPLKEFFRVWRLLNPNTACIEIGGILGNSDRKKIQILTEIGSNISIMYRINKEVSIMYGLRGSLQEQLRNKPPPLPVTLGYDSASLSEKKELEKAIEHLSSMNNKGTGTGKMNKDIELVIDVVVEYDAISNALRIHSEIIKETREKIAHLSNSEHQTVLNGLLEAEFYSQNVSE
ncbi:MAG: hypothetical protein ACFFCZ_10270 [Promethearchaeota archaeon]